ncbi:hypothetical protein [Neorhizobium sp. DT-125]|uniref:hypothetical protein n=1 Tax=Neorhizobium sp. DT-125 TaxID=3396163 RepID=UPI003F1AD4D9
MSLGLSLGLSLGNPILSQHNRQPPKPSVADTAKAAIEARVRFKASYDGANLIIEPYALFKTDSATVINAVVIYADSEQFRDFEPQYLDISKLSNLVPFNEPFFPNWAFRADRIDGLIELIAAVELVEYPINSPET